MELEFWATTDVGRVRDHNEDNFLVDKRMKLFVVCDGMGGHAAGEVASAMSVKVVREVLSAHREVFDRLEQDPDSLANRKSVLTLVEHAIQEACARIYQAAQDDPSRRGMGTTCSLLLLAEGRGFIGHVGDSRIYLWRQDQVHQITEDHSLINEMIRLGKIKKGEEHNLPHKNAVTRAVGVNEFVEVDTFELDVFGGDSFLLCSDGLSGYFTNDEQIADLMRQDDVKQITEESIDFANAGGGKDNITAIVVRITSEQMNTRDIQRIMDVMRATPFFQYLVYKEMVQMVNLSKREEYESGQTVMEANEDPGGMYLVVRGKVVIARGTQEIGSLGPAEYFAETSIIDETPQTVTARAVEDTVLLMFQRERFMEILRHDPNLAVKLLWNFLQTFTIRMRGVRYEDLVGALEGPEEPTPPSGTLVFDSDVQSDEGHQPSSVSGEFVAPSLERTGSAPARRPAAQPAEPSPPPAVARKEKSPGDEGPKQKERGKPASRADFEAPTIRSNKNVPTSRRSANSSATTQAFAGSSADHGSDATSGSGADATAEMQSADSLGALEWDEIVPGNLMDSESEDDASLRETAQMDREAVMREDTRRTSPDDQVDMSELRKTIPAGPSNGLGKAISGESVVKNNTPQAQVLKRTKLIVGEGGEFDATESTREVKPLRERKSDSTLELEIDDDNVEEIP